MQKYSNEELLFIVDPEYLCYNSEAASGKQRNLPELGKYLKSQNCILVRELE